MQRDLLSLRDKRKRNNALSLHSKHLERILPIGDVIRRGIFKETIEREPREGKNLGQFRTEQGKQAAGLEGQRPPSSILMLQKTL